MQQRKRLHQKVKKEHPEQNQETSTRYPTYVDTPTQGGHSRINYENVKVLTTTTHWHQRLIDEIWKIFLLSIYDTEKTGINRAVTGK